MTPFLELCFVQHTAPTWSSVCHFLHKVVETALFPGKGRPACHSGHFEALQSLLPAVVCQTAVCAGKVLTEKITFKTIRKRWKLANQKNKTLSVDSHLVICDAFIFLEHLQKLFMFIIILGYLLSVELQQLPGRTEVCKALMDGRKWGIHIVTRGTNVDSVVKEDVWLLLKIIKPLIKQQTFKSLTETVMITRVCLWPWKGSNLQTLQNGWGEWICR